MLSFDYVHSIVQTLSRKFIMAQSLIYRTAANSWKKKWECVIHSTFGIQSCVGKLPQNGGIAWFRYKINPFENTEHFWKMIKPTIEWNSRKPKSLNHFFPVWPKLYVQQAAHLRQSFPQQLLLIYYNSRNFFVHFLALPDSTQQCWSAKAKKRSEMCEWKPDVHISHLQCT